MLNENFQSGFYGSSAIMSKFMNGNAGISQVPLGQLFTYSPDCHYGGTNNGAFHVMIGGGDTAPTRDEYDMADTSIIATNKMKPLTQSASWTLEGGAVVTTQWQNASSEPITVKEVALVFKYNGGSSSAYNKGGNIMIARKILTTPITVQPSEVYAFSYGISI